MKNRIISIIIGFFMLIILIAIPQILQDRIYTKRIESLREQLFSYTELKTIKYSFVREYSRYILSSKNCQIDTITAEKLASSLYEWTNYFHLDPQRIFKMMYIETGGTFNPDIRGKAGEIGLMQLLPSTAELIAGDKIYDLEKINDNIYLGCKYMRILLDCSNDYTEAMAKYNAGRYWRTEGLKYVKKVVLIKLVEM